MPRPVTIGEYRMRLTRSSRRHCRSRPHTLGWYAGWYDARQFLLVRQGRRPLPRLPAETAVDVLDYVDGAWAFGEVMQPG